MSYQVLARKWRPAKFEQMVGQSHVLHALTNALTQNRLHHAYLFSGTRGVGKTSLARLFAKGLNCEQGVTASPCGVCASCEEIAQGRFVDLIEVDAASRTKVDDTRELLDNVQYRPTRGRYKVYLIDEVHMLSRSSFNALLKTLEEPPEHVKFLLATTDPQRLPVTVLSRCLQFNLKSLTLEEIKQQLSHILKQEAIGFDEGAIKLLAKAANGSMRDALSLTDQAIAFGAGQLKLTLVQTMLGTIDEHHVIVLLKALCDGDVENLMRVTDEVLSFGGDPSEVLRSLLELLHQITLTQFAPAAAQLSVYAEQIKAFATQLSPEQVQLYYQLLLAGRKDLPHAPDLKSGLEMALLRAVAFVPETPVKRWLGDNQGLDKLSVSLPSMEAPAMNVSAAIDDAADDDGGEQEAELPEATLEETRQQAVTSPLSDQAVDDGDTESAIDRQLDEDAQDLFAEQSVILSQAASLTPGACNVDGGENQTASVGATMPPATQTDDKAQDEVEGQPKAADTGDEISLQAKSEAGLAKSVNAEAKPEADKASHLAPDPVSESASTASVTPVEEYAVPDDIYMTTEDSAIDDGGDFEAYLAYQQGQESPASIATASSGEDSDSQTPDVQSDDLLNAVLAARQSLLSDLDEEASEESAEQKPQIGPKAYVPPKRETASPETSNSNAQPSAQCQEEQQTSSSMESTRGNAAAEVNPDPNCDDRPPWEATTPETDGSSKATQPAVVETSEQTSLMVDEVKTKAVHHEGLGERADLDSTDAARAAVPVVENAQQEVTEKASQDEGTREEGAIKQSRQGEHLAPVSGAAMTNTTSAARDVSVNDIDLKWYRLMSALDIGGRVRQLAVNSVCLDFVDPLPLMLKPNQKHLEAPSAVTQLEEALSRALGGACRVTFSVGIEQGRETPLEIRQRFHQELLGQAYQDLQQDENIQWLQQMMQAQMEDDSLSYLPELLGQRGQTITLIDRSNFNSLVKS